MLSMIFACDEEGAIGRENALPWRQSTDMKHFKRLTLNKTVVMGRKTWESIGRPLPHRRNIVMTRSGIEADIETMDAAEVLALSENEEVMIIGGGEIYALFLEHAKEVHRTVIHTTVEGADAFAPDLEEAGFYLLTQRSVEATGKDDYSMTFEHWIV